MMLTIVAAMSANRAIGKENKLLWHMPADLKHFRDLTTGQTVIMGRKTFDAIGKPLPNRKNIVISRQRDLSIPGVKVMDSLAAAIAYCEPAAEIFIIGGAQIYAAALSQTDKLELTVVEGEFEGDAFFPDLDPNEWKEISRRTYMPDEKNKFPYTFLTLIRS